MCKLACKEKKLVGLNLQLQLCRALGFILFKGRLKNPPVINSWKVALSSTHLAQAGLQAPEQRGKGKQLSSRSLKGANRNAKFN